jgi:anaerobic magnesium-protoporphyrin IX monomethyl ester cyclase
MRIKVLVLVPPPLSAELMIREGRCTAKSIYHYTYPPVSLAYIAAVLEDNNIDVKLHDANVRLDSVKYVLNLAKDYNMVIMNTTTPTFLADAKLARLMKEEDHNKTILFTGTHSSTTPEECLDGYDIDFIARGEPEYTILELVKRIETGNKDFSSIKGLSYKKDRKVVNNPDRGPIDNLDELPFPARHHIDNYLYTAPLVNGPIAMISTSRGCPYLCTFCNAPNVYGRNFRSRSSDSIIREIEEVVKKYDVRNFAFYADTFTLNKKVVLELCDRIKEEGLKINWVCNSRVDTLDEELVKKMKEAGCILITFGIESGNQYVLNKAKKGINLKKVKETFALTKRYGILRIANFIFGLEGDTKKTIEETIKFSLEIDPDFVYYFVATPYPGTEFYDYVKANSLLLSDDWKSYGQMDSAVIKTVDNLGPEDLARYVKKAYRKFFLRPRYLLRTSGHVLRIGGVRTAFSSGFNFLKWSVTN